VIDILLRAGVHVKLMKEDKKYNILHMVGNLGPGGAELRLIDYLRVADRGLFDHYVACVSAVRQYGDVLHELGIPVYVPGRRFRFDLRVAFRLADCMSANSIDLVHTRNATANIWGGLAARIAGVRCHVAAEHGTAWTETFGMRIADRIISSNRSCTVAVSAAAMAAAERIGVAGQAERIVIPDGVDVDRYDCVADGRQDSGPERDLRTELGLKPSDKIVTMLGRVVGTKGHAFGIESMSHLPDDIYLVIAGSGPLLGNLKKYAKKLDVSPRVFFLGFRDDVPRILLNSDLLIAPSIHDTRSGAATEAMAAGLPVVASDVDGFPEIIENGVTGLLVPVEEKIPAWAMDSTVPKYTYDPDSAQFKPSSGPSPEALANAIMSLLRDKHKAVAMAAAGREKVRREMSVAMVARRIEEVYLSLLHFGHL
jgi:glycosyltransferase involved in cell wall biosynthesis